MKDKRFPKAPLLKIKFCGMPSKLNYGGVQKRCWKPHYHRLANAGMVYVYPFQISWRLPWHPNSAYSEGWNARFRQEHSLGEFSNTN